MIAGLAAAALVAYGVLAAVRIERDRPAVVQDDTGRWRAARVVHRRGR